MLNSKMRLFFIFVVFILLRCNECTSSKTIVFIYDKMHTTEYDIDRLSGNIQNISTKLFNDGLDIHFKIIFPFKSYIVEITDSATTRTQSNVRQIEVQSTLISLQTQLRNAPTHSVICVITNVTAPSDESLIPDILEQIQIRRTEVNFLIENGYFPEADNLQNYTSIISVSSGLIFPKSFKLNQFSGYPYEWFKAVSHKVNLLAVHHTDSREYCINYDSLLTFQKVNLIFKSFDVNEYEYEIQPAKRSANVLIQDDENKYKSTSPEKQCIKIHRNSQTPNPKHSSFYSFNAFSRSDFDIDYGFSIHRNISSLLEAHTRPINSTFNRIYITSSNKRFQARFLHFFILFLNGTDFKGKIRLHPVPKTDLFTALFEPPNEEYFYIQATALVGSEIVYRMSTTAMNAAAEDEDNPTHAELNDDDNMGYINLKIIFLILAFTGLAGVLLCQFFRYIECFKKTPQLTELGKTQRHAVPNFYQPVASFEAQANRVTLN